MLFKYIKEQYEWNDPDNQKADSLAKMVNDVGVHAEIFSLRKYFNIINNFNVFLKFNRGYKFDPETDFVVYLLILKEAWQPVYEDLIQRSLRNHTRQMEGLIIALCEDRKERKPLAPKQRDFLYKYLGQESKFAKKYLYKWFNKYPTLA
jgi:hypothetical protein